MNQAAPPSEDGAAFCLFQVPSTRIILLQYSFYSFALLCLALANLPLAYKVFVACLLLYRCHDSIRQYTQTESALLLRVLRADQLSGVYLLWDWLVIVYPKRGEAVLVASDSCSDQDFRRLRVWLRFFVLWQ